MNERKKIEKQIENLLVAQVMFNDIPNSNVNLGLWASPQAVKAFDKNEDPVHTCGSAACFGGWVAMHPHFIKQGVLRGGGGQPYKVGTDYYALSKELFGDPCMFSSFKRFGAISDKDEVMTRIDRALDRAANRLEELDSQERAIRVRYRP